MHFCRVGLFSRKISPGTDFPVKISVRGTEIYRTEIPVTAPGMFWERDYSARPADHDYIIEVSIRLRLTLPDSSLARLTDPER